MITPEDVRRFWFGVDPDDRAVAKTRASLWWSQNPATDHEIRRRFEPLLLAAEAGDLEAWRSPIENRLSLILVTDQFPRNVYRDTPDAFRFDPIARELCVEAVATRAERLLRPIERVFVYMPLEHSENIDDQRWCEALFRELTEEVAGRLRATFAGFLDYAIRHREIVERFGRFPHRNSVLGRESTREEVEFLRQPGSSF